MDKYREDDEYISFDDKNDTPYKFLYITHALLCEDEWLMVIWIDEIYKAPRATLLSLKTGKYISGAKFTNNAKEAFIENVTKHWYELMESYKKLYTSDINYDVYSHGEWNKFILPSKESESELIYKQPNLPDFTKLKSRKYPTIPFRKDIECMCFLAY
jgi:hypothetical protein